MDKKTIILEIVLNAPANIVWKALTDKNEMKKWYFELEDFKPEVGFKFHFTGGPSPEKQYLHLCEITEVIPGKKLTHSWRYDGIPGNSWLTFELTPQGNKTLLKLTHSDLDTFPKENPDLAISNFEAGWDSIINDSLTNYFKTERN